MQKRQFEIPVIDNMQFSIYFINFRRLFSFFSLTILFLTITCNSLFANEQVKFLSFLPKDPQSRSEPARATTRSEDELLAEGYMPIGNIDVWYDTRKCIGDKCTQYSHEEDSVSRLLKEAAIKGGDLVVLTAKNKRSEEEDFIKGECLKWEDITDKVEVPVYKYVTRDSATSKILIGYEYKNEKKTICKEFESSTIINSSIYSHGTVWRKGSNSGLKKKENKQKPQGDREIPLARVGKKSASSGNYKIGYIDKSGKFFIEPRYSASYGFSKGLAPVQIEDGGKWGYIDKTGEMVIEPFFEKAEPFKEGLALVKLGGRFGYINTEGIFRITPKFENAYSFSEGLAAVMIGYKYGFIDKSGELVIEPAYSSAEHFSEGLARVGIEAKYGYIDKSGTFVIKPMFLDAKSFSEGLAVVKYDHKYGFIDKSGLFVIKPKFEYAKSFSEGLAAVQIDRRFGFINKSGKFVIIPDLIVAEPFSNGLAKAAGPDEQKKSGYINKHGKFVFHHPDCKSSDLSNFSAGLATVKLKDNKYIIIDSTGKSVGEFEADQAYEFTYEMN
ncbi:MAG: WG repeat-containing protein [Desulfatiglandaceae bacterium]